MFANFVPKMYILELIDERKDFVRINSKCLGLFNNFELKIMIILRVFKISIKYQDKSCEYLTF